MPIYTYPDLKGRIKVGNTVIHKGKKKKVTEVADEYFWLDDKEIHMFNLPTVSLDLLEEKTLDTVDVGDVVVSELGDEYRILDTSKNGTVLFCTIVYKEAEPANPDCVDRTVSRRYLESIGYTVKQSPQPVIMTREEAEKELSKDGKQVKIV